MKAIFIVLSLLVSSHVQRAAVAVQANTSCEDRIHEVLKNLPMNSLRVILEAGDRGDCVRQVWMDQMEQYGVREVAFRVEYLWKKEEVQFKIRKITYLRDFNSDDHSIVKKNGVIRSIVASGLERKLREVVLGRVRQSPFAKRHDGEVGRDAFGVSIFCDEALPTVYIIF